MTLSLSLSDNTRSAAAEWSVVLQYVYAYGRVSWTAQGLGDSDKRWREKRGRSTGLLETDRAGAVS